MPHRFSLKYNNIVFDNNHNIRESILFGEEKGHNAFHVSAIIYWLAGKSPL